MTPVTLQVLLHYYFDPEPYPHHNHRAKAAEISLVNSGILVRILSCSNTSNYETTLLGDALVQLLLDTPLPVEKKIFVDPRTDKVIECK